MPHFTSYEQAEDWLLSMTDYERLLGSKAVTYNTHTFDLDRFREQLRHLGDPHLRYAVIHVAGTKGKGSTCAFLEAALRSCGFRTGLYTSPHLYRFTERIRVDGEEIAEADFCRLVEQMGSRIMAGEPDLDNEEPRSFRTVFEILTAAAFQHFADCQVDVAIIETGLGGRLDSTNVFDLPGDGPLINVITAIGLDHTSILGNTVEEIAAEKAGILRSHGRMVVATQPSAATEQVVREVADRRRRDIHAMHRLVLTADEITVTGAGDDNFVFSAAGSSAAHKSVFADALVRGLVIRPSLEGAHQQGNVATALLALRELEDALAAGGWVSRPGGGGWPVIHPDGVVAGLERTAWLGRFTLVEADVPVVIDGAHCVISAAALARACAAHFGQKPAIIVTGFLRDKAGDEMLRAFLETIPVAGAIALPPPSPRAQSAGHILDSLVNIFGREKVESADSVAEALGIAQRRAREIDGYVVLFGSLYLVGPALDALK